MGDRLLTLTDVAHRLQLHERTVKQLMRDDPLFPLAITVGRSMRWRPEDLAEYEWALAVRARIAAAGRKVENPGHSGSSAPPGPLPASRRENRK